VGNAADFAPSPACGPPPAEATGGGPKPFALRPKAAFWRRAGGRRPEGFGAAFRSLCAGRSQGEKHEVYATGFRL
jgi:hypothetical protein